MRRSNTLRKAILALAVLAVFMVILRISRPEGGAIDLEKLIHKNTAPVATDALHIATAPAEPPTNVAQPAATAETGGDVAGAADAVETEKAFDAQAAFKRLVLGADSPPVVIFSKSRCPYSMDAKQTLLETHRITPAPRVVELDLMDHGLELQAYLGELTGRRTVPNVFVNGRSIGGASDLDDLGEEIVSKFLEWGEGRLIMAVQEPEIV